MDTVIKQIFFKKGLDGVRRFTLLLITTDFYNLQLQHSMMVLHNIMTAEEASATSLFSNVLRTLGPLPTFSCSSLPQITFQTSLPSSPKALQDLFLSSKQTFEPKVSPRVLICF